MANNNKSATIQGLTFEEIIQSCNKLKNALQLKISPCGDAYLNSNLSFGKKYPVLLNVMYIINGDLKMDQYLVAVSDDYELAMKELKKFQRTFKKITGKSLIKNRMDRHTNEPIWTSYIE